MKIRSRNFKSEVEISGNVGMVKIPNGYHALVDVEDVPLVNKYNWSLLRGGGYAKVNIPPKQGEKWKTILMHRLVMNASKGKEVDHINGDRLDNRKANLRLVTRQQNCVNRKLNKNSTSGAKGVSFNKNTRVWKAYINVGGKRTWLGDYPERRDALIARLAAEKLLHGNFRRKL